MLELVPSDWQKTVFCLSSISSISCFLSTFTQPTQLSSTQRPLQAVFVTAVVTQAALSRANFILQLFAGTPGAEPASGNVAGGLESRVDQNRKRRLQAGKNIRQSSVSASDWEGLLPRSLGERPWVGPLPPAARFPVRPCGGGASENTTRGAELLRAPSPDLTWASVTKINDSLP